MPGMAEHKTIGVLGGLGPEATLDFFAKLLQRTNASTDQDHLRVIIDNNPKVPNRNLAMAGEGPSPGPALAAMASGLENAGADFLVMACHSAHAFEEEIRAAITIPFISMIDETCDHVLARHPNVSNVGLLAADACRRAKLYETALGMRGYNALGLDALEQRQFMSLLYDIKRGDRSERLTCSMGALGERLVLRGAEVIIAACTEVPLVIGESDLTCALIDATDVLANCCVRFARGELELLHGSGFRSAV